MNRPKLTYNKAPKRDDPGHADYWTAVAIYERDQAIYDAVHADPENLYAVETANENLINYIIAHLHEEEMKMLIFDMVNEFDFKLE